MSASEFGRWLVFLEEEPLGGGHLIELWSQLMASLHNGSIVKKSRARWTATDFARARWAPREPAPAKRRSTSVADVRKHIQALKAGR